MDGGERLSIGPIEVALFSERGFLDHVAERIGGGRGAVMTYAHAHTLYRSCNDAGFTDAIRSCDLCYCDGIGVSLASAYCNRRWLPKVTANSYWRALLDLGRCRRWKIALVGGTPAVAAAAARTYQVHYGAPPALSHHGYFPGAEEEEAIARRLAAAAPDLLILGLGQPRQERFAQQLAKQLPGTVIICVGGLLDFLAGQDSFCPNVLRKAGLEWLFRLARSPRRLWRRYLLEVPWVAGAMLTGRLGALEQAARPDRRPSTRSLR